MPGLRREEVALPAGISVEYYLRLEQGRDQHPSAQVLDSIANALRLDPDAAGVPARPGTAATGETAPVPAARARRHRRTRSTYHAEPGSESEQRLHLLATLATYRPSRRAGRRFGADCVKAGTSR